MDRCPASPLLHARQLDDPLGQRCALFVWTALVAAVAAGLLAWGPVHAPAPPPRPATLALWFAAGTQLAAALICMAALGAAPWPRPVRRALRAALAATAAVAALTVAQAGAPDATLQLAADGALVAAATWTACALLADRFHLAWSSFVACALVGLATLLATGLCWLSSSGGGMPDLRALWLMAALPMLLLPAGVLSRPGAGGPPSGDAKLLLGLHSVAVVLQFGSAAVLPQGASVGLMAAAWCLVAVAGLLAYRAVAPAAAPSIQGGVADAFTHASTSANT